jgi:hypothetical protein
MTMRVNLTFRYHRYCNELGLPYVDDGGHITWVVNCGQYRSVCEHAAERESHEVYSPIRRVIFTVQLYDLDHARMQ